MSVLILGPREERQIASAINAARANPISLQAMMAFANRDHKSYLQLQDIKPGAERLRITQASQNVILGTYWVSISFEQQPIGFCRHLSVSSRNPKKVPGLEVMQIITEAFGFSDFPPKPGEGRVWVEEFEPGRRAINVVQVEPPPTERNEDAKTTDA